MVILLSSHREVVANYKDALSETQSILALLRQQLTALTEERDRYRELWVAAQGATYERPVIVAEAPLAERDDWQANWTADDFELYADWSREQMGNRVRPEQLREKWLSEHGKYTPLEQLTV